MATDTTKKQSWVQKTPNVSRFHHVLVGNQLLLVPVDHPARSLSLFRYDQRRGTQGLLIDRRRRQLTSLGRRGCSKHKQKSQQYDAPQ